MAEILQPFKMKQGDRYPSLRARAVKSSDGTPYDLTGATIRFFMYDGNGTKKIDQAAVVEAPTTSGLIRYDWGSGETDKSGHFLAEFRIDFGGGAYLTIPNDGFIDVEFVEKLPQVF